MNDWWRSWHGAPTDNKWLLIGRKADVAPGIVAAIAWALLDYASQQKDRGSVEGFDVETYSVFSGFEEAKIVAVIDAMKDKKLIQNNRLASWEKRQPKREGDNSTERTRAYRERIVTQRDASEQNVTLDTDTDTEEIREESKKEAAAKIEFDFSSGTFSGITDEKRTIWKSAYPAIDLEAETRKAAAWLIANPKNRKSNYGKFLNGWFSRSQDSAPRASPRRQMPSPAGG